MSDTRLVPTTEVTVRLFKRGVFGNTIWTLTHAGYFYENSFYASWMIRRLLNERLAPHPRRSAEHHTYNTDW